MGRLPRRPCNTRFPFGVRGERFVTSNKCISNSFGGSLIDSRLYMPYNISEEKRQWYRSVAERSRRRKQAALNGELEHDPSKINTPTLRPETLMPKQSSTGLRALSLFSGGGGLDLGFERAGFEHVASFDVLEVCGATLRQSRPRWQVFSGPSGDVTQVNWSAYKDAVDVVHGGPPCQPFSIAGKRDGGKDRRDMWPAFIAAVLDVRPTAFVAENVPGLLDAKFNQYVHDIIFKPLHNRYYVRKFRLQASDFGVPQSRNRVIFVGFASKSTARRFRFPSPTHYYEDNLFPATNRTMGARAALGLTDIGFDNLAPTLRSGFTGPRKTTSVLNSKASQAVWKQLRIWPNGVQKNRAAAVRFPPENGHFRLSIQDCAVLQGFPSDWHFAGAVYQVLGQIGNSVCPPVGYAVARAVSQALKAS